eukprot:maker-scaffold295_size218279-snap-gene-0.25 protein:Tk09087 transcript:maker-scaffold295_size218279-snap-gene-0.25-mRNA-1 annotation:"unnamed protein product"
MAMSVCVVLNVLAISVVAITGQEIPVSNAPALKGFPAVDVNELNPLSLNWNQVHYLVREMLIEADDLKREHDLLYKDIQSCYGLEECLQGFGLLNTQMVDTNSKYAEDTLLSALQRGREVVTTDFRGRGEAERREYNRMQQYQQRNASQFYSSQNGYSSDNGGRGVQFGQSVPSRNSQNQGGSYGQSSKTYEYAYEYNYGDRNNQDGGRGGYDPNARRG